MWTRAIKALAVAGSLLGLGPLCEPVEGQSLLWAKDDTATTNGGVNVAVSRTHAYTYGTFANTSGAVLKLYQYDLGQEVSGTTGYFRTACYQDSNN